MKLEMQELAEMKFDGYQSTSGEGYWHDSLVDKDLHIGGPQCFLNNSEKDTEEWFKSSNVYSMQQ